MDNTILAIILTGLGTVLAVVMTTHMVLHNLKIYMDFRFDKIDKAFIEMDNRVYATNQRMDGVYNVILKRMEEARK
jgi:hypothetical protein